RCRSPGVVMQVSVPVRANNSVTGGTHHHHLDVEEMLDELLDGNLVLEEDWQGLESATRKEVLCSPDERTFLDRLVGHGLLNNYQACRIEAGTTFGMILGNYR